MAVLYWIIFIIVAIETLACIVKGFIRGRSKKPFAGGNGCNLFNSPKREACCNEHDRQYKEGGWFYARFQADNNLWKCIREKDNLLMASLMYVGCRIFGGWAFQWAKKITVNWNFEEKRLND